MSRSSSPCSTFLELVFSQVFFGVERNCERNTRKASGSLGTVFLSAQLAAPNNGEPERKKRLADSVWLLGIVRVMNQVLCFVPAIKVSMT